MRVEPKIGFESIRGRRLNDERAEPVARANGPERPWLILNVSQEMKSFVALALITSATLAFGADSRIEAEQERARQANYREYAARISALTSRLESFIVAELVKGQGASEFPPARRYAMRDLDGDKKD